MHVYEIHPRKDHRGVDLISDVLPFGRLWYGPPDNAIGYAMHSSRSHNAVIRVYDAAGNVIKTHEHAEPVQRTVISSTSQAKSGVPILQTLRAASTRRRNFF